MRALLIDAYDCFIYSLHQYVGKLGIDTCVIRHNQITLNGISTYKPDFILLGPGPGHPEDVGYIEIIKHYGSTIPILGICLGHQAIGMAYGAKITKAHSLKHGKISQIVHDKKGCFSDYDSPFRATRYHSLIVSHESIPDSLTVSAYSEDDYSIMGLRHKLFPIESVQFHPESICTDNGLQIISSFIATYCRFG
jgi:glutamine amidotransferase of anthranilate synthase or aminodeoxychorismate synthase